MNKTVAALLAVIVLLIAALAFMIGHRQGETVSGGTKEITSDAIEVPAVAQPEQSKLDAEVSTPNPEEKSVASPAIPSSKPALNAPFTPEEKRLIAIAAESEETCRGSSDEAESEAACERRSGDTDRLNAIGICWGREDQSYAEYDFHRCRPGSIGFR